MERREGKTKRPDPDEGRRSKVSSGMSKQQTDLEQAGHIRIAGLGIADDPYDDVLGEEEVLVEEATQTDDQEDSLGEDSDGQEDPLGEDSDDGNQIGDDSDDGNQLGDDCDSVYLVACHWDWYRSSKPCSVYKMMDVPPSVSSPANQRLQWVESLETDAAGKMFTTVRSRRRAWIVGVGGYHGSTVIFDTKTNNVIHGPILKSAKWCPVLAAVGEKVYAMSKVPSWKSDPDFPPWFEVLDLSKSRVVTVADRYCLKGCLWREVPIPPCFPWKLSPSQYTILPIVMLMSYVVVDHYMLVSFNQSWGTLAFDTDSHEWHKVNDARLPFTGCAVKHGSIFLALSEKDGPISAYCIRLAPSGKDNALQLSVDVLAVKHEEHGVFAGSCFSSLDNKHFCSLSVSLDKDSLTFNRDYKEWFPKEALVNLTTYQIDNSSIPVMSKEAQLHVKQMISVSSKQVQDIKISNSHGFSAFGFSLLSI